VARDGSGRHDVTQGEFASWSPDGARIVFVRDGGVWTAAPDGSAGSRTASVPGVAGTVPRWLTTAQTASLRPSGNCDTDVSENDATYEGGNRVDTFLVTAVRVEVYGVGGNDLFVVGHANAPGSTVLDGGAGNDDFELFGSANNVTAGDGNDRIDALLDARAQNVSGGAGNAWARGGAGNDRIDGGPGNDALFGQGGANTIYGGGGNDTVSASVSSSPQHLFGGPGNDRVVGGRGPDAIYGGTGHDRIVAGAGSDVVHAQDRARDVVDCGAGRDTVYADRIDVVARNCERVFRR
jgi:Ca2+-binding RTX toxin-like protein